MFPLNSEDKEKYNLCQKMTEHKKNELRIEKSDI